METWHVVEIDGQDFVVESPEEAASLLAVAKETAEEAVEQVFEAPIVEGKPAVKAPRIRVRGDVGPELTALVAEVSKVRNEIRAMYEQARRNAEIAYLMRLADDEEAIAVLWMS